MAGKSICLRGIFPRTAKFLQTVLEEFGVDFSCSKRTDFVVIPDGDSIDNASAKSSIRELLAKNKHAQVVTLSDFVYSTAFSNDQQTLIADKLPVTRPQTLTSEDDDDDDEDEDWEDEEDEDDEDDDDLVDATLTPKPSRLSFAAHDQVRVFDKTKPTVTVSDKPAKIALQSVPAQPQSQEPVKKAEVQFQLSMEVGGAVSPLARKTVAMQCETVLQVRVRDLVSTADANGTLFTSLHLFVFGTSLDHTSASDNRAIKFFLQHFPGTLAPFLYSGAFTVARAVRLAYDTTQARFCQEVDATLPEDEVSLASLSVILIDDVITGTMLVFSFGNNRIVQYDAKSRRYTMQPDCHILSDGNEPEERDARNTIVLVRMPDKFPGWSDHREYVDKASPQPHLSIASASAFGSAHWVDVMQGARLRRQSREIPRTGKAIVDTLGIQIGAFAHEAHVDVVHAQTRGSRTEVLLFNHIFALGVLQPTTTDRITPEFDRLLHRTSDLVMERKQLSDLAQHAYDNLLTRAATKKKALPAELMNPVVMRITLSVRD